MILGSLDPLLLAFIISKNNPVYLYYLQQQNCHLENCHLAIYIKLLLSDSLSSFSTSLHESVFPWSLAYMCSKITFLNGTLWHWFLFFFFEPHFQCFLSDQHPFENCLYFSLPFPLIYLLARSFFIFYVSMSLWTSYSSVANVFMATFLSSNWYTTDTNKYIAYMCAEKCSTKRKWLGFQAIAVSWSRDRKVWDRYRD